MFHYESMLLEIKEHFYFPNENIALHDVNYDNNSFIKISHEKIEDNNKNLNNNSLIRINIKDDYGKTYQKDTTFNKFNRENFIKYYNNTIIIIIYNHKKKITKEIVLSDFNIVNEFDNNLNKNQIQIGIETSDNKKYINLITLQNNEIIDLSFPFNIEIILKDNNSHCYKRIISSFCKVEFIEENKYLINIKIKTGEKEYDNIFYYKHLITNNFLNQCKNSKELLNLLKEYIDTEEKEKIIITKDYENYIIGIKMPYKPKKFYYIIKCNIKEMNDKNCKCSCKSCNICLKRNCFCNLIVKILAVSKIIRIFFQIGEIYFSLIVLGIYLETITIFITGANKIYINPLLLVLFWIPFLNFISIFPIVIQFWETIKLRYLKDKCPLACGDCFADEENVCEFILDIIFLIMELLYIYSFLIYNSDPNLFEQLNLLILIVLPGLRFGFFYLFNAFIGIKTIIERIKIICNIEKCQNIERCKNKLVYEDFEDKIKNNKPPEYFGNFEPVALLMHSENIKRDNKCSCDCCYFCFKSIFLLLFLIFILCFFSVLYSPGTYIIYLLLFCLFSFCITMAVPNRFLLNTIFNCCKCCYNEIIYNIDNKIKPFKYIFFFVIILVNFVLFTLYYLSKKSSKL